MHLILQAKLSIEGYCYGEILTHSAPLTHHEDYTHHSTLYSFTDQRNSLYLNVQRTAASIPFTLYKTLV